MPAEGGGDKRRGGWRRICGGATPILCFQPTQRHACTGSGVGRAGAVARPALATKTHTGFFSASRGRTPPVAGPDPPASAPRHPRLGPASAHAAPWGWVQGGSVGVRVRGGREADRGRIDVLRPHATGGPARHTAPPPAHTHLDDRRPCVGSRVPRWGHDPGVGGLGSGVKNEVCQGSWPQSGESRVKEKKTEPAHSALEKEVSRPALPFPLSHPSPPPRWSRA